MAIWRNVILVCSIILAYCAGAQAQQSSDPIKLPCGSVSNIAPTLKREFGQSVTQMGITKGGSLIQVYVADQSWTLTVRPASSPDVECLMAVGNEWQAVPEG